MKTHFIKKTFQCLFVLPLMINTVYGQEINSIDYRNQLNQYQKEHYTVFDEYRQVVENQKGKEDEMSAQSMAVPPQFLDINCQKLWISGANVAWNEFGRDIGDNGLSLPYFDKMFKDVKAAGGNSMRWWLHTNVSFSPDINSTGKCTGMNTAVIPEIKSVLDLAWQDGIVLDLCLFSFDMLQDQWHMSGPNNLKFLQSKSNIQSYIDNALTPMVNALKNHPALWCWEVYNEPEGMTTEFGWTTKSDGSIGLRATMFDIQRSVNMIAGAIHRLDPKHPVTNGAVAFMSLSDNTGVNDTRFKNYYRDDRLIAAGGDNLGTLDFYQVHYYDHFAVSLSPFTNDASHWNLNKPIVVAEFFMQNTNGVAANNLVSELYNRGYAGSLAWHYKDKWNEIKPGMASVYSSHKSDIDIDKNACTINHAPTDIVLSPMSVNEKQAIGTVVGMFSSSDPDAGNTFTYTLEIGGTNNDLASFTINNNQLKTKAVFDYATKSNYRIKVRSTDQGGLYKEKWFDSIKVVKNITTGLEPYTEENHIAIFPNPIVNNTLHIHLANKAAYTIEVFTMQGSKVYEESSTTDTQINTSDWKEGIYIVRVTDGNKVEHKKITILK